jgi:hypothetical protein
MVRKSNNTALNVLASNQNSGFMDNMLQKEVTFAAGTTGKFATGTFTLGTVTGTIALQCFAVNTGGSTLAGPLGTIEVGTALSTAGILPQTTVTTWDEKLILQNTTLGSSLELTSTVKTFIVTQDIIYTIGTADITGGTVTFYFRWAPISADGNLVMA